MELQPMTVPEYEKFLKDVEGMLDEPEETEEVA